MRTSVGVIGNSHLGAIKVAWDIVGSRHPDVSFEFFGSKSGTLIDTFMDGPVLKSLNGRVQQSLLRSGGAEEIDFSRYDKVWIVGGGVNLRTLAAMMKDKRLHPFADGPLQNLRNRRSRPFTLARTQFVSRSLVIEAFRQRLAHSAARNLADKIRSGVKTDVYLSHEPHLDTSAVRDPDMAYIKIVDRSGMGEVVAELFEAGFRDSFRDLAGLISQPKDTVVRSMFTVETYALAGVGLANMAAGPSSELARDRTHKNAAYGERIIELFMESAGLAPKQIPKQASKQG